MVLRKDSFFPNGILQFNSGASFKSFWEKVKVDANYANKVTENFKTYKNYADEISSSQNNNSAVSNTTSNAVSSVDSTEFINDMKSFALPEENLASVVNTDMQVIVSDTLYHFTRMGLFKVLLANVSDYVAFYEANKNNIFFDSNYVKVPNETSLGNGDYLVETDIIRSDSVTNDLLNQRMAYIDDGGGYDGGGGGGGSGGGGSPGGGTGGGGTIPDYYVNSTVDNGFNKEIGIVFNDWAKRRLTFQTRKINWSLGGFGYHQIGVKAKIQREKSFLWFTYWGPSYAEEIVTGFDNCFIQTDFVYPYINHYTSPASPTFEGLANFQLGDVVLNTFNIRVNLTALHHLNNNLPILDNAQIASWIDKQLNTVVGNAYNNLYKQIETNIINSIDPSYITNYANATKRIAELTDAASHKLQYVLGKGERPRGYSHTNSWLFDYNLAGQYTVNGGVGGYPLQYQYNYTMQKGSFFGRARVGNIWHGIRIVCQ